MCYCKLKIKITFSLLKVSHTVILNVLQVQFHLEKFQNFNISRFLCDCFVSPQFAFYFKLFLWTKTTLIEAGKAAVVCLQFCGFVFGVFFIIWRLGQCQQFLWLCELVLLQKYFTLSILGFSFSTPLLLKKIDCLLFSRGLKIHCYCKNCSEHKCLDLLDQNYVFWHYFQR